MQVVCMELRYHASGFVILCATACSVGDRSSGLHYHASVPVSVTTYSATIPVVTGSCNHPIVFLYIAVDLKYAPTLPRKWLRCICRYIMDREWLLQVLLLKT